MGDEMSLYEGDIDDTTEGWVTTLQLALTRAGHPPDGGIDGKFGWRTAAAVKAFQEDKHLSSANGVVGNETWSVLMERDPEPPGTNNGPHGGLYHAHGGSGLAKQGGAGSMPVPADITIGEATLEDGNTVVADVYAQARDPQYPEPLVVMVKATLYQNQQQVTESGWTEVNSSGAQRIPLGHSFPPGTYDIRVTASDNASGENPFVDTVGFVYQ